MKTEFQKRMFPRAVSSEQFQRMLFILEDMAKQGVKTPDIEELESVFKRSEYSSIWQASDASVFGASMDAEGQRHKWGISSRGNVSIKDVSSSIDSWFSLAFKNKSDAEAHEKFLQCIDSGAP